jgi:hypothetical protein
MISVVDTEEKSTSTKQSGVLEIKKKRLYIQLTPKLKLIPCVTAKGPVPVEMCGVIKTKCNLWQHKALHCIALWVIYDLLSAGDMC